MSNKTCLTEAEWAQYQVRVWLERVRAASVGSTCLLRMPFTDLPSLLLLPSQNDGYLILKNLYPPATIAALNARLDDIMQGTVQYGDNLVMQLDPSTAPVQGGAGADAHQAALASYEALGISTQSVGFKGPSDNYRKIGEAQAGLEVDPLFAEAQRHPLLKAICGRVYGAHAAIAVYRSMVMAKPAANVGGGSQLIWHQDGGDHWALDRDPLCFVWTALTPATVDNGAVQVVRGSHKLGLLSRRGHTLSVEQVKSVVEGAAPGDVVDVVLEPGDAFLCHNWTVHRSGVNVTPAPRRGFSVNYIDARTRVSNPKPADAGELGVAGTAFPIVWPSPW